MSQLLVRNIEPSVVRKLRSRASSQGVSLEEAHRRLLRDALANDDSATNANFIKHLCSIPKVDDAEFPRSSDLPRDIDLGV